MRQKRRPTLRPAPPTFKLDGGNCQSSRSLADEYGNRFLDHWFVSAQESTALPELRALSLILKCNAEDWGREEFATNCLKTALGLSQQAEQVWPGLYQLAALIKERGYYTQDLESFEHKRTLPGCETFEEWFTTYIHPSFEAFTRMEEEFRLAEQTGAPLPRTINFDGLAPGVQVKAVKSVGGYPQASAVVDGLTAPHGGDRKSDSFKSDNIRLDPFSKEGGTGGVQTYRKIQKLARGGNAEAAELLDQIDRGETTPHAAYVALGLRRPQISAQLEPELHGQLMAWTESTGDSVREVVESALEMFFRRMKRLEEPPEPESKVKTEPVIEPPTESTPRRPKAATKTAAATAHPAVGDLISGLAIGPLLGRSKAHANNRMRLTDTAETSVVRIEEQGWVFSRDTAAEETRWLVEAAPDQSEALTSLTA